MDGLLFPLVYFAAVIVFVIIKVRKARRQKENTPPPRMQAGRGTTPPPQAEPQLSDILKRIISGEDANASLPPPASGDEEDDSVVETAWRDFRPPEPSAVIRPPPGRIPPPAPKTPARHARRRKTGNAPSPEIPAAPQETPVRAEPIPAKPPEPAVTPPLDFPARLARLSPLQQAFVMTEVLGKPRALRTDERL